MPRDILVFEHVGGVFQLIGGSGRGAGWAGIVEVAGDDAGLVGRAWQRGTPSRHDSSAAGHIAGPYHARHAIAIPVGERHVVVLGDDQHVARRDADAVRIAADAVDRTHGVPADKLLADELELVHALRALMAYRAERVRDTMRHIATVAATALSCDVALVRVEQANEVVLEVIGTMATGDDRVVEDSDADRHLASVARAATPMLQQAGGPAAVFGLDVASHLTLPIGTEPVLGAIALGHALERPRGFTSLCQRIGRAVAEAAELLISQAVAREALAAELDRLARLSATDALTGVGNRRAWDDEVARSAAAPASGTSWLVSVDLDGLKDANDRYGHAAGDALVRASASLISACVRDTDLVVRIGGDEFVALLRDADAVTAEQVRRRIRRAEARVRVTEHRLAPRMSVGLAPILDGDLEGARCVADDRMYANKRRRRTAPPLDLGEDRRGTGRGARGRTRAR